MPEAVPVIAIDGTAGSGKGTLARNLAVELGWHFLDSGALYRAVSWAVLERDANPGSAEVCAQIAQAIQVETRMLAETVEVRINGEDCTTRIRTPEVGRIVSQIAAHPPVRAALLRQQRAARKAPGLVADGRDMGTVVFPDACVKFHLTASLEVRAQRRQRQLEELGLHARLDALIEELGQRDLLDTQRETSPLAQAPDACRIDTSAYSIAEVHAQARACLPDFLNS